MLSRLLAVLILFAVGIVFLVSSEDGLAVSLFDWLRDPSSSRRDHASWVASERERAAEALALDESRRGLVMIDDSRQAAARAEGEAPWDASQEDARALLGDDTRDDMQALLAASSVPLRGVVVAPDGSPLEGVTVGASQPGGHEARTETDANGAFELRLRGASGSLAIDGDAWVALGGEMGLAPGLNVGRDVRVLVLAPRADLRGRTFEPDGRPLAGARVVVEYAFDGLPPALRGLVAPRFELAARSDLDGYWRLVPLPDLPGMVVRFEADGRVGVERDVAALREDGDVYLGAGG